MDYLRFASSPCGRVVHTRTGYDAFVPNALSAAFECDCHSIAATEEAGFRLGILTGQINSQNYSCLPLLNARDAIGGVRSEGTPLTLIEFFAEGADPVPEGRSAVRTARNYAAALQRAGRHADELPLCLRLMRQLHGELLEGAGDPRRTPGQFRRSQNWLGPAGCMLHDATFVPPPIPEMQTLLGDWERFLHEPEGVSPLVRLAIAHHQYLLIHPFLDMNALAGALIAAVVLQNLQDSDTPLPVFGRFLERHSGTMQQRTMDVCVSGRREEWVAWYLGELAGVAKETAGCVTRLQQVHTRLCQHANENGDDDTSQVLDALFKQPVMTTDLAARMTRLSSGKASTALRRLEAIDLVSHIPAQGRSVYAATSIIEALDSGPPDPKPYALPF